MLEIDSIVNRTNFLDLKISGDETPQLYIQSSFNPRVVDTNFNELEGRIINLESPVAALQQQVDKLLAVMHIE